MLGSLKGINFQVLKFHIFMPKSDLPDNMCFIKAWAWSLSQLLVPSHLHCRPQIKADLSLLWNPAVGPGPRVQVPAGSCPDQSTALCLSCVISRKKRVKIPTIKTCTSKPSCMLLHVNQWVGNNNIHLTFFFLYLLEFITEESKNKWPPTVQGF